MGELDRTRALDDAALDPKNYWPSLIGAALSRGLLSDADMARIQGESAALFVRQAERLTRGESTSLRAEKARELTESIACVLGTALRRCPEAGGALETLRREPLDAIFDRGLTIIRRRLGRARAIHERLKETLFVTRNVFYKSTIVDGLDAFFRLYRPEFSAQEIHITADYPPFRKGLAGNRLYRALSARAVLRKPLFACFRDGRGASAALRAGRELSADPDEYL